MPQSDWKPAEETSGWTPVEEPAPSAMDRFLGRGAAEAGIYSTTVGPALAATALPQSARGAVELALGPGGRILTHMFDKARDAIKAGQAGNYPEMIASGAEAIPVVGQVAETLSAVGVPLAKGDVAGAIGAGIPLAVPFAPKMARVAAGVGRQMAAGARSATTGPGASAMKEALASRIPGELKAAVQVGRDIKAGLKGPGKATAAVPPEPPPPPFSGNPTEPTPVVPRGTSKPVQTEAGKGVDTQGHARATSPETVEPMDLEAQLRESIARVQKKTPPDPAALSAAFDQPAMREGMAAKAVKARAVSEGMEAGARVLKAEDYGKLLKGRGITATQAARLPKDSPFWATAAEELRNSKINSGELTWEQAERMKFKPPSARTVAQIVKMLDQ